MLDEEPEAFFVVEIAEDIWGLLDEPRRRALVDHELAHCKVVFDEEGEATLGIAGHDLEEFRAIVERRLWRPEHVLFVEAAHTQQALELDGGAS